MAVTTRVEGYRLWIGERFWISFQRTLRIPDDGRSYPLPPGLGGMPVQSVEPHADRLPAGWRAEGGYFIPMYQREALWLGFGGAEWKPNAVQVMVGRINAISGQPWTEELQATPQNYVVCPDQPWLDGINAGEGFIRQFVAMPLGSNYTVEGQVTGSETSGGIQIIVYEPKPGIFPDEPPAPEVSLDPTMLMAPQGFTEPPMEMGLAAGGKIKQKIYPDPYGIDTWDQDSRETVFVHLVNSGQYKAITNEEPPPTPIDAKTYTEYGLPWFDLYDEAKGDVSASEKLAQVKSVTERDAEINSTERDETSIDVPESQITKLKHETQPKRH